ncbi:MAG TPA: hypothetical protein VFO32_00350 [Sphingomicrobium sp.]|nr:hypothetical protein [Sphingomicrobium sp.]
MLELELELALGLVLGPLGRPVFGTATTASNNAATINEALNDIGVSSHCLSDELRRQDVTQGFRNLESAG